MSESSSHFPLPEQSRPNPDREAAYHADQAWKSGKWLQWAEQGGQERTPEAEVILGGRYDTRALGDVGLDGTVLGQNKNIFRDEAVGQGARIMRWLDGKSSVADKLMAKLQERNLFYTSPVVRESERLLSSNPIEVNQEPDNIVMYWERGKVFTPEGKELNALIDKDTGEAMMSFTIPKGKRLIIDNIPKGSKYDKPYTDELPIRRGQVQVYQNVHGYLVADKIVSDIFGGLEVSKKTPVSLKQSESGNMEVDLDAPRQPAMENLYPSNDRKQEFKNPLNPDQKTIQLLTTTSEYAEPPQGYGNFEITVTTPDDASRTVDVTIDTVYRHVPPKEIGPVLFRLVDNTSNEVAHSMYQ